MTFAQRRNRLTTHFSESTRVVKRRKTCVLTELLTASTQSPYTNNISTLLRRSHNDEIA